MSIKILICAMTILGFSSLAMANDAPATDNPLSNGATSILETYGEWQLSCELSANQPDAAASKSTATVDKGARASRGDGKPALDRTSCSLEQTQRDNRTGMQVFGIQFAIPPDGVNGSVSGVAILPFGIAVSEPWQLVTSGMPAQQISLSTCLPLGCVLPLRLTPELEKAWSQKSDATISGAIYEKSQPVQFTIKLNGFSAGLARLRHIVQRE